MNPNYQQEWRAKNSNKVRAYHSKENNHYVLDKKYPELPFIWKHKEKKKGKLVEGPCQSCSKHTVISISKLLKKEKKYEFCNIPTAIYCNTCLPLNAAPVKPGELL